MQVDYDPRFEAFWRVGGFHLSKEDEALRKAKEIPKELIDLPIDRFMQYFGSPLLQLRSKLPLPALPELNWRIPTDVKAEITDGSESTPDSESSSNNESSVSKSEIIATQEVEENRIYPLQSYRYRPDVYLQIPRERIHGAIIPGTLQLSVYLIIFLISFLFFFFSEYSTFI